MGVTGQDRRLLEVRRGKDDCVRRCEIVRPASLGGGQSYLCVKRYDLANLREGDHLVCFFLADFASQPFRKLELDHGWDQPVSLLWQVLGNFLTGRTGDQPFNPGRGIDEDHQNRSARSRYAFGVAPFARPFRSSRFGMGTSRTPLPFGMKAKVNPASQCCAVRIALGIEIWNFEDRVAVSAIILRLDYRSIYSKKMYIPVQGSIEYKHANTDIQALVTRQIGDYLSLPSSFLRGQRQVVEQKSRKWGGWWNFAN